MYLLHAQQKKLGKPPLPTSTQLANHQLFPQYNELARGSCQDCVSGKFDYRTSSLNRQEFLNPCPPIAETFTVKG